MSSLQEQNNEHSLQESVDNRYAFPSSFAQQRLWFLDRLLGASGLYNISWAIQLNGKLDVSALQQSLNAIVARHEVLRTCFIEQDGEPFQVISASMPFACTLMALSAHPQEHRDSEIQRILDAEGNKPFDLKEAPLIRASLLKLSEQEHILLISIHHIVSDGWSMGVLKQELASLYGAFSQGQSANLPELPIQYADYAVWQREWLQGEVLERQLGYWKTQLADLTVLELPTDRPRPKQQSYRGARAAIHLSAALTRGLKTLSQQHNVTLFMTLLAALQVLLHRYSGQEDIVVGTAIAGRNRQEIENLIGFFVNTLALRTDLSGTPSFVQLLSRIREVCLSAYAHQDLPFEKLVAELQVQRDMSRHPLFQVMLVLHLQPAALQDMQLPGLTIGKLTVGNETAKFDLSLSLVEHPEGLTGSIEYSTDLFNAETITRLAGHFQTLLAAIALRPETAIAELPLLTAPERHQLLVEWNATRTDYPKHKCIHQLFEEQVARTPDAIAVVFEDQQLSYQALNAQANQLAHYLKTLGVKADTLVAICMERSLDLVIGLLAILKAGGAYVPLDPAYPSERLAFMLDDTSAPVLIIEKSLQSIQLNDYPGHIIVFNGQDAAAIAQQHDSNPSLAILPGQPAYMIYTSGSTGEPKGVVISHQAVIRLIINTNYIKLTATDRIAQVSNISFDAATFEIWGALLTGARLIIIPKELLLSVSEFNLALKNLSVSTLFLTTAFFNQMVKTVPGAFSSLKNLLFGGEAVTPSHVRELLAQTPPKRLLHVYGPTETTTFATWFEINIVSENATTIPIGRPLANTLLYVLDKHLQPVPVGITGELYIGGDGVALGYHNRPELNNERFLPNLFNQESGRLYKTGDLVRYLPDGAIEFLGRIDHQIKLRGFRIELGEIESVLAQHPGINEIVVTVREDQPGDKRLVAYLTHSQAEPPNVNALRLFLKEKLPEYMAPSAFVLLDKMPLTPNGKIDRKALPAPDQTRPEFEQSYVPPRSPIEEMLVAIWREVLKVDQIGIHDSFFELGGHSLLAVQLIVRINKQFQIEFPLHSLFEAPTVAGLSVQLETVLKQEIPNTITSIKALHRKPYQMKKEPMSSFQEQNNEHSLQESVDNRYAFPTSFAQQRLWFLDRLLGASGLYNISWAIQLNGKLDVSALQQSLNAIVARHEVLRTYFVEQDGEPVQIIRASMPFACTLIALSAHSQENRDSEIQGILHTEGNKPFDLKEAPLIRALLLKLSEQEHILLISIHHIASDGWSMGVLRQELASLYGAFTQCQSANLPELPIQYADYAVWQREWLQGEVLERQLGYWKTQLADLTVLELPTDRPRPKQQSYRGARAAIQLSAELTQGLKTLSQQHNVTLFMTLLAAFQVLLHRYSGQDDIVVGSPIAGRNKQEVENLIGLFLNTLVLRNDLSGNPGFSELLQRVRRVCIDAYAHQDMPFETLVAELNPQRDLSRNPFFDVLVNQFDKTINPLELKDLKTHSIQQAHILAKFSLTLYISVDEENINLNVVYQDELFTAERIASILEQYRYLLEQIIISPDTAISNYSLVTAKSRPLLPDPAIAILDAPQILVQESFLKWASCAPDNIAVSLNNQQWTYRDLADSSIKLAYELTNIGLEKGQVAGITGAPSFGLIANIIAVFLSGGVILTIDEQLPVKRKQSMLSASSAKILCVVGENSNLQNDIEDLQELIIINVNPHTAAIKNSHISSGHGNTELPEIKGDDSAYIFFTSGSTGVPKGVLGCHKGLSHFINWQREHFKIDQNDRVAQLTSLSFDVFLRDLFLPLTSGATLCLPEAGDLLDTISWLYRENISVIHTVPSIFRSWLDRQLDAIKLKNPRYLFIAGEPLTDDLVNNWRQAYPESGQIINLYGPTETTLAKLFYVVPDVASNGIQPIGQSIPQTQALILNQAEVLCGVGEIGQITIRTPFRSLGYINLPEQTSHAFRKNPFSNDERDIVYYTGDLGRYRSDGSAEILGRIDNQIKIRGVRIEPEEITAILDKHDAIYSSVVIAVKEVERNYLVGYVVPKKNATIAVSEIRRYLSQQLPQVMIPEQFVFLDKIPLKANGKIDRDALPAPDQTHSESEQPYVPPRSPIEEMLVAIWREVLKVDQIGVHDNFFELGGHSLLAVQLIVRINKQFQIDFPLHLLFEEPTVAGLSKLLITTLEQTPAANTEQIHTITRDLPIPASFAQQRLWFLDRLLGASGLYNISWAIQLNGKLDVSALQQSLNAIVARHEVLRTYFVEQDGEPVQVIRASIPFACTLMALSAHPQEHRDSEIQRILHAEGNKPFDLKEAPLIRTSLLKLSEQEHILLISIHHIVSDGWSMGVLRQELASLYGAFSQGQSASLPELPIQYADYAIWQREWLQGEVLERQLGYWKTQLADLTVLELPTDRPRPKQQSYRGARAAIQLSAELTQGLKTLSQQHNVTLFMTLLAALQVLLHRYSGQEDIVVGTAIAGRNRQEIENLIGFFVNTLALRTDLSGTPSFVQLLSRVREVCLSAYAHQDLPFEKLVAELQVQRDMSRHPLFQVMLVLHLQPAALQDMQLPGLTIGKLTVGNETAKFDLSLSLVEHPDGLTGTIEYSTDLFNAETITRLAGHFQTLLAAIALRPETAIAELPLLTAPERQQLLVEWNATKTDYPKHKCIHQLFEEQAARTPDAIALVFEDQQLSYQALNAKANQLAHYLTTVGVKADTLVAICMERSLDLVIGLLAILKAGGAYVPLDPAYPSERLAFMLDDTKAPVLLTHSSLTAQLPSYSGRLVCLDTCRNDLNQESTDNPRCNTASNNLAYVIYTSGSTGVPKGIEICHYNIARLLINNTYARFDNKQNFLLSAPIAFDASTFEIWGGLLHGARCVIYPERVPTLNSLEKIIKQQQISILWLTASLFNAVIDEKPQILSTVAQVLTGGEALSANHIQRALEQLPDSQLINGYGPTESTTFTCCYPIPKTIAYQATSIPIGYPIANTQVYILDKRLQAVPIGVAGELHIGGDGLARGYLNRPELTAEKFIKHPFSDDPHARLYKTGDLARYLPDGTIEFLGRIDHQIKLRGFRIELGEIESVLGQHPGINEVVVTVREDQPGDKRLVAYLTHRQEPPNVNALRLFLKEKLPEYMVPSAFVLLDKLPLTPNGKIDRKALPTPDQTRPEFEQSYVPPRSPIEEMLVAIWREVLNIDQIGIHDSFFELGGHSLLAIVLCTKIEAKIGKPVPVELIFKYPTVNRLSGALALEKHINIKSKNFNSVITPLQIEGTQPPFFWLLGGKVAPKLLDLLEHMDANQPLYLLNHQSMDGNRAKHLTIPEMASYYLQNILQIDPEGPYYLGGYSIGGMICYEIARQLCEQGKKVPLLFLLDPTSISNDKDIQNFPTLYREYYKLKNIGYVNYFKTLPIKLKNKFQKELDKAIIQIYFSLGKSFPTRLHWSHLGDIYGQAKLSYQPEQALEDIEKAVIIHINNRTREDWSKLFNGKIETYAIDCGHGQLLETPHVLIWLKILKQTIKESLGK